MNNASVQENVELESLIARVADEFRESRERGDRPQIEDYAARYPEAADLLRKVLGALELIGESMLGGLFPAPPGSLCSSAGAVLDRRKRSALGPPADRCRGRPVAGSAARKASRRASRCRCA